MNRNISLVLSAIFFLVLFSSAASADSAQEPWIGKTFRYEFGWKGFTAAQAKVSIKQLDFQGVDCYKLQIELKSLSKLDWIWKVRDKMTSFSARKDLVPQRYIYKQREGKFSLDTEILLDPADKVLRSHRTRYLEGGGTKQYSPKWAYAEGMTDPLGALMFIIRQDLKPGQSYKVKTFDGKREHKIEYQVTGTTILDTKFGKKECFVVVPKILKSSGGGADNIQSNKISTVTLYVASTPDHTVYRIESKTFFGAIYAELVEK